MFGQPGKKQKEKKKEKNETKKKPTQIPDIRQQNTSNALFLSFIITSIITQVESVESTKNICSIEII